MPQFCDRRVVGLGPGLDAHQSIRVAKSFWYASRQRHTVAARQASEAPKPAKPKIKATDTSDPLGEDTRTDYRVGGFMAGLALHVGLRLESPHPWNQGMVE